MTRERFNDIELLDEWEYRLRSATGVGLVEACDSFQRAPAQDIVIQVQVQDVFNRAPAIDHVGPPCR